MKKLFLFTLMILTACVPAQPQVTVTSEVTITLPPPTAVDTPTLVPSPTVTFTPTPAGFTIDQLAEMSSEDKIAAANGQVELPEGVSLDDVKIKVEAGHVVTYSQDGEHVAVYNLATGETHDQMGVIEYGDGIYQRCFYDNDWDYEGYTPSLEERGMLKEQICTMAEGGVAVNSGLRRGLYKDLGQQVRAPGYDMTTTAGRLAFYNEVLIPEYRKAVANGTLFADGGVIPLDGNVQIKDQLPDVYVVFEYNAENSTVISSVDGKPGIPIGNYSWVDQEYYKDDNTLTITIGMDQRLAQLAQKELVGGPVVGSMGTVFLDQVASGLSDFRGQALMNALGVTSLGSNRESANGYGDLNPDSIVQPVFDGLEASMYNRK
jgi:hypothetical protein